jgi:hypothetical protein
MSTRSLIGYDDGIVHGIYCHYDGYPSYVGKILVQHHNSLEACNKLMSGPQIRNLDHDGTIVRYGDTPEHCYESYSDVKEALNSGFDYVYLFDWKVNEWSCFTKVYKTGSIKREIIPTE